MSTVEKKRKRNHGNYKIITDFNQIKDTLIGLNREDIINLMDNDNQYFYVEKMLTFADIPTFGKYCYEKKDKEKRGAFTEKNISEHAESNYLFYSEKQEIINYEKKIGKIKFSFVKPNNLI